MGKILNFKNNIAYECGDIHIKVYKLDNYNSPLFYIDANDDLLNIVDIIDDALTNHNYKNM